MQEIFSNARLSIIWMKREGFCWFLERNVVVRCDM